MAAARVRLVVVNYDGGDDVIRCVGRLLEVEWPADRLEVVVVDNASRDGSADALAAAHPSVRLIRVPTNQGFPANNLALGDLEEVDYVGLVNNDAFVEPSFLAPLVAALEADPGLGAACPKILLADRFLAVAVDVEPGDRLDAVVVRGDDVAARVVLGDGWEQPDDLVDGRPRATASSGRLLVPIGDGLDAGADPPLVTAGGRTASAAVLGPPVDVLNNVGNELVEGWFGSDRGFTEPDAGQFDEPADVFGWCGAAVLFPTAYLHDVGLFDERLFLYYEDLDLAWRGRGRGWRYRTVPTSVVRHRLGATSRVGSTLFRYHVERNRLVVLVKNAPGGVAVGAAGRHLLASASYLRRDVLGRALTRRRPAPALAWLRLRSFAGFLRLLPHALRQRRRIDRTATVPRAERPFFGS